MPPRIPKPVKDQSPKPRKQPPIEKVKSLSPFSNVDAAYVRDDSLIATNPIAQPTKTALNFTRIYNNCSDPITDTDLTWEASQYTKVSYKADKKWTHTVVLYRLKSGELECQILKVKEPKPSKR